MFVKQRAVDKKQAAICKRAAGQFSRATDRGGHRGPNRRCHLFIGDIS